MSITMHKSPGSYKLIRKPTTDRMLPVIEVGRAELKQLKACVKCGNSLTVMENGAYKVCNCGAKFLAVKDISPYTLEEKALLWFPESKRGR